MAEVVRSPAADRILFLDHLRALAVLLVVWGHVFLVGINDPATVGIWVPTVKGLLFGPDTVANNIHGQIGLVVVLKTGISSGPLGVAIFFLISGYIIPRTIERSTPLSFLIRRFFRIVPTCVAAVIFVAIVTALYCYANGVPQPNSIKSVIASSFAANYFNGAFATIPVLWTLTVEIVFYIVIAATAMIAGRIGFGSIVFVSVLCLLYVALLGSAYFQMIPAGPRDKLMYIGSLFVHVNFMLIGSLIYRGESERRWGKAIACILIVLVSYLLSFKVFKDVSAGRDIGMALPDIYCAMFIFCLAFLVRLRGRWLRPLQWIGDISYPLYLLHVPIGWGLLAIFGWAGLGMNLSACLATAVVIALSWVFHRLVEVPSQVMGHNLARKLPGGGTSLAMA